MYIPETLETPLRILIPLLIFGIALFVALTVRKRYTKSLVDVYLSFVLTDAALSLSVYRVNFQGAPYLELSKDAHIDLTGRSERQNIDD